MLYGQPKPKVVTSVNVMWTAETKNCDEMKTTPKNNQLDKLMLRLSTTEKIVKL